MDTGKIETIVEALLVDGATINIIHGGVLPYEIVIKKGNLKSTYLLDAAEMQEVAGQVLTNLRG
jgi:hypothetical protein